MKSKTPLPVLTVLQLLFILSIAGSAAGQQASFISKAYLTSTGLVTSSGSMSGRCLQVVFRDKWSASVSHYSGNLNVNNLPSDYQQGENSFLGIAWKDGKPKHNLKVTSFTAGKFAKLSRSVWFTTEAGISINRGFETTFQRQTVTVADAWIIYSRSSNYTTTKQEKTVIGGIISADLKVAFSPFTTFGIGFNANPNSLQTTLGGQFSLSIGWMHRGPKNK